MPAEIYHLQPQTIQGQNTSCYINNNSAQAILTAELLVVGQCQIPTKNAR